MPRSYIAKWSSFNPKTNGGPCELGYLILVPSAFSQSYGFLRTATDFERKDFFSGRDVTRVESW